MTDQPTPLEQPPASTPPADQPAAASPTPPLPGSEPAAPAAPSELEQLRAENEKLRAEQSARTAAPVAAPAAPAAAPEVVPPAPAPEVTHNQPTLTYGAAGPAVLELVVLLQKAGYASNSIAQGTNTVGYFDETVMADARAFAQDHGVAEDPAGFQGREGGDAQRNVQHHVGPVIWQTLIDVTA
jgi:hypothetical protein